MGNAGRFGATRRRSKASSLHELAGAINDPGPARETTTLLGVTSQVRERRRAQPALHLLETLTRAYRREHVGPRKVARRGVVHVVRRHDRHVVRAPRSRPSTSLRATSSGAPWSQSLDGDVVAAEALDESRQCAARGARPLVHQRSREWTLATPREHQPLSRVRRDDLIEREARTSPSPRALSGPVRASVESAAYPSGERARSTRCSPEGSETPTRSSFASRATSAAKDRA